jgi:hypothetical protein
MKEAVKPVRSVCRDSNLNLCHPRHRRSVPNSHTGALGAVCYPAVHREANSGATVNFSRITKESSLVS